MAKILQACPSQMSAKIRLQMGPRDQAVLWPGEPGARLQGVSAAVPAFPGCVLAPGGRAQLKALCLHWEDQEMELGVHLSVLDLVPPSLISAPHQVGVNSGRGKGSGLERPMSGKMGPEPMSQ